VRANTTSLTNHLLSLLQSQQLVSQSFNRSAPCQTEVSPRNSPHRAHTFMTTIHVYRASRLQIPLLYSQPHTHTHTHTHPGSMTSACMPVSCGTCTCTYVYIYICVCRALVHVHWESWHKQRIEDVNMKEIQILLICKLNCVPKLLFVITVLRGVVDLCANIYLL
jgi:hypothetical protein